MTDADIGQLTSTQEWVKEHGMSITSWDDEDADIRREQERDARDSLTIVECRECGYTFPTDTPDDDLCDTCHDVYGQ